MCQATAESATAQLAPNASAKALQGMSCGNLELRIGPNRPQIHKNPTQLDFWYPPFVGPWNQDVRSLCLAGRFQGPVTSYDMGYYAAVHEGVPDFARSTLRRPHSKGA